MIRVLYLPDGPPRSIKVDNFDATLMVGGTSVRKDFARNADDFKLAHRLMYGRQHSAERGYQKRYMARKVRHAVRLALRRGQEAPILGGEYIL